MGNPLLVSVDDSTLMLPPAVLAALSAYNEGKYTVLPQTYVWSQPNNASGAGPGGVTIDATAGANIARNTTAKASEGYVAIGRGALGSAMWGRSCIAIGPAALGFSNPGFGNVAIGTFALANVTGADFAAGSMPGSRNVGIGPLAGHFITSGYRNVYTGRDAGQTLTTGARNVGYGYRAHACGIAPVGLDGTITNQYPIAGNDNAAIGDSAGGMLTGDNNVVAGSSAFANARSTSGNTILGYYAGNAVGAGISENGFTIAQANIAGSYSQSGSTITITAAGHGAAVGKKVSVTFASGAVADVTGEPQYLPVSAVVDANSFRVSSPISQSAAGNATLNTVETATTASAGGANVFVGYRAGATLTSSANNTLVGSDAMSTAATGNQNVTAGQKSLGAATSASNSVAVGFFAAGNMAADANQVTALGASALRNKVDGTALTDAFANITGVGYDTRVSGSNQLQLGNTSQTVYAQAAVQTRSDERDKAEIRDTELGLEFIEALRPVDFKWDRREDYTEYDEQGNGVGLRERDGSQRGKRFHHGFIAQEVGRVIDELGVDFGGFQDHTVNGGDEVQSIGYEEVIAPLVKAVQELAAQNAELTRRLDALT